MVPRDDGTEAVARGQLTLMSYRARAVVLTGPKSFEMHDFDMPTVREDDAVIQVEACGICGTDYEQYRGDVVSDAFRTPFPAVPGHEPVGQVSAIGPEAARRWGVAVGDRIAVRPVYGCGRCSSCLAGNAAGCNSRGGTYGLTDISKPPSLWGGYAEYMYVHPLSTVVKVPTAIPSAIATLINPLACGLSWGATTPRTQKGDHVVVLGSGQRGLACAFAAKQAGAETVTITGLSKDSEKLELARHFGATSTIVVDEGLDIVTALRDATGGAGADVVVDTTPFAVESLPHAVAASAQRGRIVLAGIKGRRPTPNLFHDDIVLKQLTIFGVSATTAADFVAAGELLATDAGRAIDHMHTKSYPLAAAEEAVLAAAGVGGGKQLIHVAIEPGRT